MEQWKIIEGYENYEVSNYGNVRNNYTDRVLKPNLCRGYHIIRTSKDGKVKKHYLHRLVANAFIENPNNKKQVDHIDNNRINNNVNNLRFCSNTENCRNKGINKTNTSGIKGVTWDKRVNKWKAEIGIDGITIHLGCFDDIKEAKQARIRKVNEVFGNFVHSSEKM